MIQFLKQIETVFPNIFTLFKEPSYFSIQRLNPQERIFCLLIRDKFIIMTPLVISYFQQTTTTRST